MHFRIADTFTDSLSRLPGEEQKAAKTAAFDLQMNPAHPGLRFHRLDKAKDRNFWSVRVSGDVRLIVHRTDESLLLCYVGRHDDAYAWAERRKLETHPRTGAAQIVEVRETVREIEVPYYVTAEDAPVAAADKPPLFGHISDDDLMGYGVPAEWLDDVRQATEDSILELADHLPAEAGEALLEIATGGAPRRPTYEQVTDDPFAHPDAQRRFRVMDNLQELQQALEYPWERWTVFLHPAQRGIVERHYNGPARVSGSAGTGKTIVAVHRAVHLARANPDARVLLATFSDTLARSLQQKLERLAGNDPAVLERISVSAVDRVGMEVYESAFGPPNLVDRDTLRSLLQKASGEAEAHRFTDRFLDTEWRDVVDAWQLADWESYRDVARFGRKTRLSEGQRALLWSIFERARADLAERGLSTLPGVFGRATEHVQASGNRPWDFVVIDEAQDVGVPQLRFLAALAGERKNGIFFAGDLGQRIFQAPFSWQSLGVDVRGRSHTLRINYRTSHQIRRQADLLLAPEISDVDGLSEDRRGTVSVFNGPPPEVKAFDTPEEESAAVGEWLSALTADGVMPHEISVCVRSAGELDRACEAVQQGGLAYEVLDESLDTVEGKVSVATMHLLKGLEFRAVAVMACDDEIIPHQERIEAVADAADLEEVYNTERHLLYVACTRARDHLLVTAAGPPSEFLEDLGT
ncbi:MAG: UvrD-helicase domain-containing protein [Chloroflexota bacterium]